MARKFALYLKDGHEVRNNIEEITEYFDYGRIVEYFHDGSLLQWLEDRRYEKEAIALSYLETDVKDFKEKLCYIFHIDSKKIDTEAVAEDAEKVRKKALITQYTNDTNILADMDSIATSQKELEEALKRKKSLIYLCGSKFTIAPKYENIKYVGLGNVTIGIDTEVKVDFEKKHIQFENINIDAAYLNVITSDETETEEGLERNYGGKYISLEKGEVNVEVVYEILSHIATVEGWIEDKRDVKNRIKTARQSGANREIKLVNDTRNNLVVTDRAVYTYIKGNREKILYNQIRWADSNGYVCLKNYEKIRLNTENYYHGIINEDMGLFLNVMGKLLSAEAKFEFSEWETEKLRKIFLETTSCSVWELINYCKKIKKK